MTHFSRLTLLFSRDTFCNKVLQLRDLVGFHSFTHLFTFIHHNIKIMPAVGHIILTKSTVLFFWAHTSRGKCSHDLMWLLASLHLPAYQQVPSSPFNILFLHLLLSSIFYNSGLYMTHICTFIYNIY